MIFQSEASPIEKRKSIRMFSVISGILAIAVAATPYVQNMMNQRVKAQSESDRKEQNDRTWSQKQKESEARIESERLKAQENRQIAQTRIVNGCVFVDLPLSSGGQVFTFYRNSKGIMERRPMPEETVVCDGLNNTAVVRNGVATDVRGLGTINQPLGGAENK